MVLSWPTRALPSCRNITLLGVLPFFPDVVARFNLANPIKGGQPTAVDDIYQQLKTWFFIEADNPGTTPFSFDETFYLGGSQQNTYDPGFASAYANRR